MTFDEYCQKQTFGKALTLLDLKNLWDNRQALIDAHNERCEKNCRVFKAQCSACNQGQCGMCPRRYMITEEG